MSIILQGFFCKSATKELFGSKLVPAFASQVLLLFVLLGSCVAAWFLFADEPIDYFHQETRPSATVIAKDIYHRLYAS